MTSKQIYKLLFKQHIGYYEGTENVAWLQGSSTGSIITDGKGLIPTRYVYLADTRLYKSNISIWNA